MGCLKSKQKVLYYHGHGSEYYLNSCSNNYQTTPSSTKISKVQTLNLVENNEGKNIL